MASRCRCSAGRAADLASRGPEAKSRGPGLLLGLVLLLLSGCSFFSFLAPSSSAGTQVPIQLDRCRTYPEALCLQSFGLSQNQLLITFSFPAAGSSEFILKVWQGDSAIVYPCTTTDAAPSTFYCTGPLIDLGTSIKIDLFTKTGTRPLAQGDFTLTDLALPTLSFADVNAATAPVGTAGLGSAVTQGASSQTPIYGSGALPGSPTPTPRSGYANPQSGTGYPNPNP